MTNEAKRLALHVYNRVAHFFWAWMNDSTAKAQMRLRDMNVSEKMFQLHMTMPLEMQEEVNRNRLRELEKQVWWCTETYEKMRIGDIFVKVKLFVSTESCHVFIWDDDALAIEFAYPQDMVENFLKNF